MQADGGAACSLPSSARSALTAYRVSIWLAPDAALLAGCALALLGVWRGYRAPPGRAKALGYALMHLGAAARLHGQERSRMAGAGAGAADAHRVGAALGGAAPLGAVRRAPAAGAHHRSVAAGCGAQRRTARTRCARSSGTTSSGASRTCAAPAALDYTQRASQLAGQIPVRAAALPAALDAAGRRRPWCAPWQRAVRARQPRPHAPGASRSRPACRSSCCCRSPRPRATSTRPRRCSGSPCSSACGRMRRARAHAARQPRAVWDAPARCRDRGLALIAAARAFSPPPGLAPRAACLAAARRGRGGAAAAALLARRAGAARAAGCARSRRVELRRLRCRAVPQRARGAPGHRSLAGSAGARATHPRRHARSEPLALLDPDETTIAMLDHGLNTPFTFLTACCASRRSAVSAWFTRPRCAGARAGAAARPCPRGASHAGWRACTRPTRRATAARPTLLAAGAAALVQRYELPQGRRYALLAPPAR